jgi:hypothetical protein
MRGSGSNTNRGTTMAGRKIFEGRIAEAGGVMVELWGDEVGGPEIYVEGVHGISATGSTVKLNMFTTSPESTPQLPPPHRPPRRSPTTIRPGASCSSTRRPAGAKTLSLQAVRILSNSSVLRRSGSEYARI